MKARSILRLLLVLLLAMMPPGVGAAMDFRVLYLDQEVSPYIMGQGEAVPEPPGMAVELVRQVAAEMKVNLLLGRRPMRRVNEALKAGEIDALIGRVYTPERAQDVVYPMRGDMPDGERRLARLSYSLYRLPDAALAWDGRQITMPASASAPEIGINGGSIIGPRLRALGAEPVEIASNRQLIDMLTNRRLVGIAVLDSAVDMAKAQQLQRLLPALATYDFHFPVAQNFYAAHQDLCEGFWRRLAERRDAAYAELQPKYLN